MKPLRLLLSASITLAVRAGARARAADAGLHLNGFGLRAVARLKGHAAATSVHSRPHARGRA